LLHGIAIVFSLVAYGDASWLHQDFMAARGSGHPTPSGYGYGLPIVYAVWISAVVLLYPACRWFGEVKKRRREVIFSYL
jgi:acyl dehydratase